MGIFTLITRPFQLLKDVFRYFKDQYLYTQIIFGNFDSLEEKLKKYNEREIGSADADYQNEKIAHMLFGAYQTIRLGINNTRTRILIKQICVKREEFKFKKCFKQSKSEVGATKQQDCSDAQQQEDGEKQHQREKRKKSSRKYKQDQCIHSYRFMNIFFVSHKKTLCAVLAFAMIISATAIFILLETIERVHHRNNMLSIKQSNIIIFVLTILFLISMMLFIKSYKSFNQQTQIIKKINSIFKRAKNVRTSEPITFSLLHRNCICALCIVALISSTIFCLHWQNKNFDFLVFAEEDVVISSITGILTIVCLVLILRSVSSIVNEYTMKKFLFSLSNEDHTILKLLINNTKDENTFKSDLGIHFPYDGKTPPTEDRRKHTNNVLIAERLREEIFKNEDILTRTKSLVKEVYKTVCNVFANNAISDNDNYYVDKGEIINRAIRISRKVIPGDLPNNIKEVKFFRGNVSNALLEWNTDCNKKNTRVLYIDEDGAIVRFRLNDLHCNYINDPEGPWRGEDIGRRLTGISLVAYNQQHRAN